MRSMSTGITDPYEGGHDCCEESYMLNAQCSILGIIEKVITTGVPIFFNFPRRASSCVDLN